MKSGMSTSTCRIRHTPCLPGMANRSATTKATKLVIDTIGFNDQTLLDDNYSVPHTTQLHVIERFKLIDDGKMLQVDFTVDDPGAFNAPWSGIVRYRRAPRAQQLGEQACAENNINVLGDRNITPTAAKADF
jgi:hypothetical protein